MNLMLICKISIERSKKSQDNENQAILLLGKGDFINGRNLIGCSPEVVTMTRNRHDIIAYVAEVENESVILFASGKAIEIHLSDIKQKLIDDIELGQFKVRLIDTRTNKNANLGE